jgi:hypothetical protein
VLVLVLVASALPTAASAKDKTMTIKILSLIRVTVPHDTAPKGRENSGDYVTYRALLVTVGPLFGKKKKNVPVGYELGTQTFTSATDAKIKSTVTFPGQGTIRVRGAMKSLKNGLTRVAIVGGTGKFQGAHGELLIGPGDTRSINTYNLSLPESGVA